ncbi:MAG: zinc ABC transporter substrate-binding protein [Syntrophaceae bacterium]|nr:zinc ABC transporter substrate-binding protein [Syntrophaceae bacterium]
MSSKIFAAALIFLTLTTLSCKPAENFSAQENKLKVVASIFPLYDFARAVGGEKVAVSMLLPAGTDAHNYELKPDEIVKVINTDVFLFINFEMEHWAHKIITAAEKTNMLAVETGKGTILLPLTASEPHDSPINHEQQTSRFDPHIWLDFTNAQKIIDNITEGFINKDPENSDYYKNNAREYKSRLIALDKKYRKGLAKCQSTTILHAGHWAFAYLAKRYKLKYIAAYSTSAEAEPLPENIFTMVEQTKKMKTPYVFYEDFIAPRLAKTIAEETGAELLKLNNGHDISKNDIKKGVTFLNLMEENLLNLQKGLSCPQP